MSLVAWKRTITDEAGNIVPSASVEVRRDADSSLATLYSDAGGTPLTNPFTADAVTAEAEFFAEPDLYTVNVTSGGDSSKVPVDLVNALENLTYETRAEFVSWVSGGGAVPVGSVIIADGLRYRYTNASPSPIADLAGYIPDGLPFVEQFGEITELTTTIDANGYTRTGGSDAAPLVRAADSYAISSGMGIARCRSSLYLLNQINLSGTISWDTGFRDIAWCDVPELESGFVITNPNGGVHNVRGIIQHNTTTKESDRGHHGNFITLGEFMATSAQTLVENVSVNVWVQRAADINGSQESFPSPLVGTFGYVQNCNIKLRMFGTSNVISTMLYQGHWGGHNATGNPLLQPVVTYHPNNIDVEIEGTITNCRRGVLISSCGNMQFGDITTDGVRQPFVSLSGDNTDQYTIPAQVGLPGRGNRVGNVRGLNCPLVNAEQAVWVAGRGTSKWDVFTGTARLLIDQLEQDITFESIYIEQSGSATGTKAVHVQGAKGRVDLGKVSSTGTAESVVRDFGDAEVIFDVTESDAPINVDRSQNTRVLGSGVNILNDWDASSATFCVEITGSTDSTVTTANVAADATNIPITAFTGQDVHEGDVIRIGNQTVRATAFIDNTVPFLTVTPIQAAVASGATVVLDRRCTVLEYRATGAGSRRGTDITYARVENADFSGVKWTGQYLARLNTNSNVTLINGVSGGCGRITPTTDNYSFRVTAGSHIDARGIRFPANPQVDAHFQLSRTGESGPWGVGTFVGCIIEDIANFYAATDGAMSANIIECSNENGAPIRHPDRQDDGTNSKVTWTKYPDGTMIAQESDVDLGTGPTFTWTIPGGGFVSDDDAIVSAIATTTSTSNSRALNINGRVNANTTATFRITQTNDQSYPANQPADLMARGRWR